jgi:hypothetical protein
LGYHVLNFGGKTGTGGLKAGPAARRATATGHERRSAAPYLFRSGKRNILIERHRLFTDPAARESAGLFVEPSMKTLTAIVTLAILMIGASAATAQNAPPVSTKKSTAPTTSMSYAMAAISRCSS